MIRIPVTRRWVCQVRHCSTVHEGEPFRLLLPFRSGDAVFEVYACRVHREALESAREAVAQAAWSALK